MANGIESPGMLEEWVGDLEGGDLEHDFFHSYLRITIHRNRIENYVDDI